MTSFEAYRHDLNPTNSNFYREDYIQKHYNDFYNELIQSPFPFKEALYLKIHELDNPPCCHICGSPLKFISINKGYKVCCKDNKEDPSSILLNSTNSNLFRESYIKKQYPYFYQQILDEYDVEIPWRERLYLKIHHLSEPQRCKCCDNYTSFINFTEGYLTYCGSKCANSDPDANEKREQSCLKKYGVKNPLSNKEVREKIKQTTQQRYGVDYCMQNKEFASKVLNTIKENNGGIGNASSSIYKKHKRTMMDRYGVENASQRECNKEKMRTNCPLTSPEATKKALQAKQQRIMEDFPDVIGFAQDCGFKDETGWICSCPHPECNKCKEKNYITYSQLYRDRLKDDSELCTKLLPFAQSHNKNTTLELFIHNILDELQVEYETSNYQLIYPKELDIYIPSARIAIECNGIYWHSSINKDNNYHFNKYKTCKDNDIQLIMVWEDWIKNQPDLVRSMIWSKLGFYKERIGARQCKIIPMNTGKLISISNHFLDQNHIQGSVSGSVRYGLYYKDELVSVMVFANKKNDNWELVRFSTKKYMQVVGGAEKMMQHFIKEYKPQQIISFSCNDISKGNLYDKLGFTPIEKLNHSYWYIHKSFKRYHRSSFTKREIVKRGWREDVNNTWTEMEVMNEHTDEFLRIHDSGQTKWVYTNNGED